jgi:TRAP-type C4-dicarboxylate transport system permease small subunit
MVALLVSLLASLAAPATGARRDAAARLDAVLVRLPLVFRPFLAFVAVALFGFFMGILLNEGLRGFTKTG